MRISARTRAILKGEITAPLYFFALAPFAWAYSAAMRVRAWLYAAGILRVKELPCRVAAVGNLAAGGTGKTPMAIYIASRLAGMGRRVAVVTRGYGGALEGARGGARVVSDGASVLQGPAEAGDEAVMMARALPGVPVVMGADRHAAGMLAVEKFGSDVVVLDDAYQHLRVKRDLNVLMMDAARPFGNGFTLPMGYLREPRGAAARADVIVLSRSDEADAPLIEQNILKIKKLAPGTEVFDAYHAPAGLRRLGSADEEDAGLGNRRVHAVAGLADPASFALILQKLHAKITGLSEFGDHHAYTTSDLIGIEARAKREGAEMVVTTTKDAVKLEGLKTPGGMDIFVLDVKMELGAGHGLFDRLLEERLDECRNNEC